MKPIYRYYVVILLLVVSQQVFAEIKTDGTLGAATIVVGPDYQITQGLGKTRGNNLFHSFESFNLKQNETATFLGSPLIENIISRVTDGNKSFIDGTIQSAISQANLYFLNPAGFVFGKNAGLDVSGSFHVSTADYMGFADNKRFYSQPLSGEILSTASPTSFGFLSNTGGDIEVDNSYLEVDEQEKIMLLAENITIDNNAVLLAPAGKINLISPQPNSEILTEPDFVITDDSSKGKILIDNGSEIEVSAISNNTGIGDIYIQGGKFKITNESVIYAVAGDEANKSGGNVRINSQQVDISNQSLIFSKTYGEASTANVYVNASQNFSIDKGQSLENPSGIIVQSIGTGQAGNIEIKTKILKMQDNAVIDLGIFDEGDSGQLNISANESILLSDNSRIYADTHGSGHGGEVSIQTKDLSMQNNSTIDAGSFNSGNGGNIVLTIDNKFSLDGSRIYSDSNWTGKGGNIHISAGKLILDKQSSIDSSSNAVSYNKDDGNDLYSRIGSGNSGNISITAADSVIINDSSYISTESLWDNHQNAGISGDAGNINITAGNKVDLLSGSFVTSESQNAGGGKITINSSNGTYLYESIISSSVQQSLGDGGDILVASSNYTALNESSIIAQAYYGSGGNISISTDSLIAGKNSLIDASSRYGLDGEVVIDTPDMDYDAKNATLPVNYLDTRQWQQKPCSTKNASQLSSLIINNKPGVAMMPDDMMAFVPEQLDLINDNHFLSKKSNQSDFNHTVSSHLPVKINCQLYL